MTKRRSILIGTALVAGAALWYLFRPDALVISKTVNESFPVAEASAPAMAESPGMAHSSMKSESPMTEEHAGQMAGQMADEKEPVKLVTGRFHTNAHETKGLATIYRLDDGRRVLRLTGFATSNGPDVRVYLVAASDVQKEDAAKRAGIPKRVYNHLFRHSRATNLLASGMTEAQVKTLLGWKAGSPMLGQYAHLVSKDAYRGLLKSMGLVAEKEDMEQLSREPETLRPIVPMIAPEHLAWVLSHIE